MTKQFDPMTVQLADSLAALADVPVKLSYVDGDVKPYVLEAFGDTYRFVYEHELRNTLSVAGQAFSHGSGIPF